MQKKKENLLDKFMKRDYNNELELILEKKAFDENAKNLLLNILYKTGISYKDYEKVKQNVQTKEEYIKNFIRMIEENCDNITICQMQSNGQEVLNGKTFLVDKENKKIVCYPIERNLLYCIAKISKHNSIIKKEYAVIEKTLSNLINIGNNIDIVEPLRDFNGYSWTTIQTEIESIEYNLIYQNLRILLGHEFLEKWINNKEFIVDYMEILKNKLEEKYGIQNQKEILKYVEKLSVLLQLKYSEEEKQRLQKEKKEVEEKLNKIGNKEKFIEMLTKQKKDLTKEIKLIDETINNKELLQKEYVIRNENLPLKEKIFSVRILSKLMLKEREDKIEELEKLNSLLNPKKFISYKKEMEQKYAYLKLADTKDIEREIENLNIKLQKVFLKCYQQDLKKVQTKSEIIAKIYELRYYHLLPFDDSQNIYQIKKIEEELKETRKILLKKAQELKAIIITSKNEDIDEQILRHMFDIRGISLEEIYIKITKEKDKGYIQLFDEEAFEEKRELSNFEKVNKKDLEIKTNKKIKIFD